MPSPKVSTPGRARIMGPYPSSGRKIQFKKSPLKPMPQGSAALGSKVRVVARVRPFLESELEKKSCIQTSSNDGSEEMTVEIKDENNSQGEAYRLDYCYEEKDDITRIFRAEVEPILPLLFCGCDATIFAYGASGSGKTHTMQGRPGSPGLMPMAVQRILSLVAEKNSSYKLEVSFYELYMERCYDLLQPKSADIPVLEDSEGRIALRGLAQVPVKSMKVFEEQFAKGCAQRKIGQTGANGASSRSHSVLRITLSNMDEASPAFKLVGNLSLIDLAGNDESRKLAIDGVRLAENSRINHSLFVLSNVINAVSTNERRVPYRDSKLTRILQESLGGTGSALMIACLSPASFSEASQTLSLAVRSRQISNHVAETGQASMEKAKLPHSPRRLPSPVPRQYKSPALVGQQREISKKILTPRVTSNANSNIFSINEANTECQASDEPAGLNEVEKSGGDDTTSSVVDANTGSEVVKENLIDGSLSTPLRPVDPSQSPPLSSMLRTFGSSLREVLSPMPSVIRNLELDTPNGNSFPLPTKAGFGWTAVEKFTANSRDLRITLLKEYLDILNTGTRDDLLAMKGIGKRRAESILKLRECSEEPPFLQLRDLQKIGVSAKQAESLFHGNLVKQMTSLDDI